MQREHGRFLRGLLVTLFALDRAIPRQPADTANITRRSSDRSSGMSEMILAWIICDLSGTCTASNCFTMTLEISLEIPLDSHVFLRLLTSPQSDEMMFHVFLLAS